MKKNKYTTQLLITLSCLLLATATIQSTASIEGKTVSDALMTGWRSAKKNNDTDTAAALANAIDTFATLQNNYTTCSEQLSAEKERNSKLQEELQQKKNELRTASLEQNAVRVAQAETQRIAAQRDALMQELQKLQSENNDLRNKITIMTGGTSLQVAENVTTQTTQNNASIMVI